MISLDILGVGIKEESHGEFNQEEVEVGKEKESQ